ncbi:MAG TPA: EAL domain-containing protein [Candidatus Dorea intestinavium]|nr:EAL domain-containing protein [Candidatus Dorea intestinavium]
MSKLLIVEDNLVNQKILKKMLENDYELLFAANGKEALTTLKSHWQSLDLILLDLIMPVMDGYTFLDVMKSYPNYSTIPIIVTTANDSDKAEVKALAEGATDYITKPYHVQIVKHRINNIISLRQTAAMFNLIKYDQLTGLFSKEFFYKQATEKINNSPNETFDIIACDIENFSFINDTFGYNTGNEVLKTVALILKNSIPNNYYITRLNNDIFAALVPHQETYHALYFEKITDTINNALAKVELIIDYGIYPILNKSTPIHTACNIALDVVKAIKSNYLLHFANYDEKLQEEQEFTLKITASMERALREKEFLIYLQPKYDLLTNHIIGAEALVRWNSKSEGFLPPGKFIPLFEKNGFICELDQYIWEEACRFLKYSIDQGLPRIPISVNVSRLDILILDVPNIMTNLINKYDLEPSDLHLEITESAYNECPELILAATNQLHKKGFILELDDFGTGYSSLNLLSEMALDVVKLDMRFARNMTSNAKQNIILAFILDLANRMGLTVISEGVETKEQAEHLRNMGCDQAQGYFFSKPILLKEYQKLLTQQGGYQ